VKYLKILCNQTFVLVAISCPFHGLSEPRGFACQAVIRATDDTALKPNTLNSLAERIGERRNVADTGARLNPSIVPARESGTRPESEVLMAMFRTCQPAEIGN